MALSALKKKKHVEELPEEASSVDDEGDVASSDNEENSEPTEGNEGWADSIAKVLNTTKPKAKKTLVLSRAKKFKPEEKVKRVKTAKEEFGFEVAEGVGGVQTENVVVKDEKKAVKQEVDTKPKNLKLPIRIKPTYADIERERAFKKIATKGVVQLFNAVRVQQKDLENQLEEAGRLDSKRDAVLNNIDKKKFLDVLMGGSRAKSEHVDGRVKKEEVESSSSANSSEGEASDGEGVSKKKKNWSVLDSDYLTSKKSKHWDEEEDDDEDGMNSSAQDDSGEEDD